VGEQYHEKGENKRRAGEVMTRELLWRVLRWREQKPTAQKRCRGYQLGVSTKLNFYFDENRYSPNWNYPGSPFRSKKHYFSQIGELKSEGEEFECARLLDTHPGVWYWVRNIERRPESSFWLQTSSDKFYPDFVALLHDGRILVVEYKGADRWSDDDSKEKRALGERWAERSGGLCLFIMPKGPDWAAIGDVSKPNPAAQHKDSGNLFQ
jgi:type III restriction enzyme